MEREAEALRKRDAATNGRRGYYQSLASNYFDRLQGGYYHDPYNEINLLWKLGLDYWDWFASHLQDGVLHPDGAELILKELLTRRPVLDEIEEKDEREHFEQKFGELTSFLRNAIALNEPVECSIR